MKKIRIPRDRLYSPQLENWFRQTRGDSTVLVLIVCSLFVAVASIVWDTVFLDRLNLAFTFCFFMELILRFFTYEEARKGEYTKEWWIGWIATIPWDLLLACFFSGGGSAAMRLLRLPRESAC